MVPLMTGDTNEGHRRRLVITRTEAPAALTPSAAAARLGWTVPELVALIRVYRYEFTERKPGGKPGDRGRNRWSLTEAQVEAIRRGQARRFEEPRAEAEPDRPKVSAASPDGKSRLRKKAVAK